MNETKKTTDSASTGVSDSTHLLGPLSKIETFWLWVMRANAAEKRDEIRKQVKIWKLKITFRWRSKNNLWGRFGGGWNWKLGIMAGGKTVIVSLFVCEVIFDA